MLFPSLLHATSYEIKALNIESLCLRITYKGVTFHNVGCKLPPPRKKECVFKSNLCRSILSWCSGLIIHKSLVSPWLSPVVLSGSSYVIFSIIIETFSLFQHHHSLVRLCVSLSGSVSCRRRVASRGALTVHYRQTDHNSTFVESEAEQQQDTNRPFITSPGVSVKLENIYNELNMAVEGRPINYHHTQLFVWTVSLVWLLTGWCLSL